jgi:hypothetical protein
MGPIPGVADSSHRVRVDRQQEVPGGGEGMAFLQSYMLAAQERTALKILS